MNEHFDAEAVLRDVREVLRRHDIPIETVSLNVSLLDAAFDEHIPQLKIYKAGHFHRAMVIHEIPLLFDVQRRYPFDEIVQVLEHEIKPPVEAFAEDSAAGVSRPGHTICQRECHAVAGSAPVTLLAFLSARY